MATGRISAGGFLVLVAGVFATGVAHVQASSVSARVWLADYDLTVTREYLPNGSENLKLGRSPMYMVQFDTMLNEDLDGAILIGYGQGWDLKTGDVLSAVDRRADLLAGASYRGRFGHVGLGAHGVMVRRELVHQATSYIWDSTDTYYFVGPDILAGSSFPIIPDVLTVRGGVSVLPVVAWGYSVDTTREGPGSVSQNANDSGTTWGYTFDAGLALTLKDWHIGGGYRYFKFAKYEFNLQGDFEATGTNVDEFRGFYAVAEYTW